MLIALFLQYPLVSIIYIALILFAIIYSLLSLQRLQKHPEQALRILIRLLVVCAMIVAFYLVVIICATIIDA